MVKVQKIYFKNMARVAAFNAGALQEFIKIRRTVKGGSVSIMRLAYLYRGPENE